MNTGMGTPPTWRGSSPRCFAARPVRPCSIATRASAPGGTAPAPVYQSPFLVCDLTESLVHSRAQRACSRARDQGARDAEPARRAFRFASQLAIRYDESPATLDLRDPNEKSAGGPTPGARAPDAPLSRAEGGERTTLHAVMRGVLHSLVVFTDGEDPVGPCATGNALRPDSPQKRASRGRRLRDVVDESGIAFQRFGVGRDATYLVRPDGYVAVRAANADVAAALFVPRTPLPDRAPSVDFRPGDRQDTGVTVAGFLFLESLELPMNLREVGRFALLLGAVAAAGCAGGDETDAVGGSGKGGHSGSGISFDAGSENGGGNGGTGGAERDFPALAARAGKANRWRRVEPVAWVARGTDTQADVSQDAPSDGATNPEASTDADASGETGGSGPGDAQVDATGDSAGTRRHWRHWRDRSGSDAGPDATDGAAGTGGTGGSDAGNDAADAGTGRFRRWNRRGRRRNGSRRSGRRRRQRFRRCDLHRQRHDAHSSFVNLAVTPGQALDRTHSDALASPGSTTGWNCCAISGAICRDGSPTGFYVRYGSVNRLLVYLEGGGACDEPRVLRSQSRQSAAIHCGRRNRHRIARAARGRAATRGDRHFDMTHAANPFKDWNQVYVPYCTGDVHFGTKTNVVVDATNVPAPQQFVGYLNMQKFVARLVPTFRTVERVVLTGASAGGFGAGLNYGMVQDCFGTVPVTVIDDSGPPFTGPGIARACRRPGATSGARQRPCRPTVRNAAGPTAAGSSTSSTTGVRSIRPRGWGSSPASTTRSFACSSARATTSCAQIDPVALYLAPGIDTAYPPATYEANLNALRTRYSCTGQLATYYIGGGYPGPASNHQHDLARPVGLHRGGRERDHRQWTSDFLNGTITQVGP